MIIKLLNNLRIFSKLLGLCIFICIILFTTSCEKEAAIKLDPPEEIVKPDNPTDQRIADFQNKYQSKIIYRWDRRYTSSDAMVYPPDFDLVMPYIDIVEQYWVEPYDQQVAGFMLKHLPIEIILVGSYIEYRNGDERGFNAAGEARSFTRILLAGVNGYNPKDTAWINFQISVMHHEFAHIIDKIYGRPKGFDDISKGKYAGSTSFQEFSMATARERGFWEPYGMSNEAEDFATIIEAIISNPKSDFIQEIQSNDLLKRKYNLVYQLYAGLGIDLHKVNELILLK
jgi:substrate import-associated zinc metallohydrolase lipoprotein